MYKWFSSQKNIEFQIELKKWKRYIRFLMNFERRKSIKAKKIEQALSKYTFGDKMIERRITQILKIWNSKSHSSKCGMRANFLAYFRRKTKNNFLLWQEGFSIKNSLYHLFARLIVASFIFYYSFFPQCVWWKNYIRLFPFKTKVNWVFEINQLWSS